MTDQKQKKREQLFDALKQAESIAEREQVAAEWLQETVGNGTVLTADFPTDCAPYFASAAYLAPSADHADVIAYGMRAAYLAGAAASKR